MTERPPDPERCAFCDRRIPGEPVTGPDGRRYCAPGCRSVEATLGDAGPDRDRLGAEEPRSGNGGVDDTLDRTFLRVDGMHGATCEDFLEARAERCAGVAAAEASYVAGTVRVEYDPTVTDRETLCDRLSTVGYTAVPRADAPIDATVAAERGDRRLDSVLGYRYAVGVLFGSFLMLPYVALVYPTHLASMLGEEALPLFADAASFDGGSAVLALPLFLGLTGIVLAFTGLPLLRGAYVSLVVRRPSTELLTSLTLVGAYLHSGVAILLGRTDVYFDLTFVIAAVVVAAIFYESLAKQRAVDRLTALTVSQIDEARRMEPDGETETVPVADLDRGDRVLVRRGERVPVDGRLDADECTVDESVVTGESLPVRKRAGETVVGGSVVTGGAAVVTVGDATSSVERLVRAVWNLQSAEHGTQRRANRAATVVGPLVVAAGLVAGGAWLAVGGPPVEALLVGLSVLLVGSPWALGLATPLSVATNVDAALRRGIVVLDETVFERLRGIDVVVLDKTGTLTTGEMTMLDAAGSRELLAAAAVLERRAAHPAAAAIVAAFRPEAGPDGDHDAEPAEADAAPDGVDAFRSHGTGVEGVVDGVAHLVGHPDLFGERGWTVDDRLATRAAAARRRGRLPVLVGRDGRAAGLVEVGDEPRPGWERTLARLGRRGIDVVVLTGDDEAAAAPFGAHAAVEDVFAGVPPEGKVETIRRLGRDRAVAMVGDGTNDAPALALADLGIALGGGTAAASDAADLVIAEDDLGAIETAVDLARAARRRTAQNTALALVYNGLAIPVAALGILNPLLTMAAVVVTGGLLAVNSFRDLGRAPRTASD